MNRLIAPTEGTDKSSDEPSAPTRVTTVVIRLHIALCDLEVVLGDDLVQRKGTSAEDLAGIAMAR